MILAALRLLAVLVDCLRQRALPESLRFILLCALGGDIVRILILSEIIS